MKLVDALSKIRKIGVPAFHTREIAVSLGLTNAHASKILSRLAPASHLIHLEKNLWALPDQLDIYRLPEYLTAPFPCYLSLQTALYQHGMIDQVPQVIYAVSPARPKIYKTVVATVDVHHISPEFFFGYKVDSISGIRMALPEKALIDILYLALSKKSLFRSLPEIELPKGFSLRRARDMIRMIGSKSHRTRVLRQFEDLIKGQ